MEASQEKSRVMVEVAGREHDGAWLRVFEAKGKHDKAFRQLGETVQAYAKLEKELRRAKRSGGRSLARSGLNEATPLAGPLVRHLRLDLRSERSVGRSPAERPQPNLSEIKEEMGEILKRISREKREVALATRGEWEADDALFEARKRHEKAKRLLKAE